LTIATAAGSAPECDCNPSIDFASALFASDVCSGTSGKAMYSRKQMSMAVMNDWSMHDAVA
jgi:hypothetical protein